jgi:hypothetical protein
MSVRAKTVLENKFWIVEDNGQRIGTLSKNDDGYILAKKGDVTVYQNERQLKKHSGLKFTIAELAKKNTNEAYEVHGYPAKGNPYNSMFDIKRKLPLFTKSEKSKSVYCAGFYLIKFNVNWLKSFCPKLITVERNEYIGPFKTELEMKEKLRHVNRAY